MESNEPKKPGGPVEVEIPQLKVQEKEKKGGGIVLPGSQAAGNAAVGGGAGLAQVGAKAGFAAMFTGKIGAAAAVIGLGGAGLVGYGVMQQPSDSQKNRQPELGGLSSSIAVGKRNAKGSKSLSYMAKAGEGELRWDNPNGPKKDPSNQGNESSTEEELADSAGSPAQEDLMAGVMDQANQGDGNEGGPKMGRMDAKLSTELGNSSAFGSKSIFSGGTGFDVARMKKGPTNDVAGARAKTSARSQVGSLRRGRGKLTSKSLSTQRARSNRAMGQLKFAGRRSGQAANASSSGGAAQYAQDAFGATETNGGEIDGAGGIGEDMPSIAPPGSGAPDGSGGGSGGSTCPSNWTALEGGGCEPPDMEGQNVTPYQTNLDSGKQMADTARTLMTAGAALLVIGAILVATAFLSALGVVLLALGAVLLGMGMWMSSQAQNQGTQIAEQYGQKDQGKIVERYGDDSDTASGMRDRETWDGRTEVSEDVAAERDSNFTLE